jgi:hypothetical protein
MKNIQCYHIVALIMCLCIFGCKSNENTQEKNPSIEGTASSVFQNIVILTDLSSRIKMPNQYNKDTQIIKKILQSFQTNQMKYSFIKSKDRLALTTAYQSSNIFGKYKISQGNFTIDMENKPMQPVTMTKPAFDAQRKRFEEATDNLYSAALKSPTSGADIWGFFCSEWSKYYMAGYKNKVIILTDGYLEFDKAIAIKRPAGTQMNQLQFLRGKNNWEDLFKKQKLTPCGSSLKNVDVLIVEINPKNKATVTNEYQIIEKFWKTWFTDMNAHVDTYQTDDEMTITLSKIDAFLK